MLVDNLENKATLVTSLYFHRPQEILGGRGWSFDFFASPFRNVLSLNLPLIVFTHDQMEEDVSKFLSKYAINDYKIINRELTQFEHSNQILSLLRKTGRFKDDLFIESSNFINDRNTHLCLSKLYWLNEICDLNPFHSNNFYWIDAGLFHHGIFPETFGGMERLTKLYKQDKHYAPHNKQNIFNQDMGNFLSSKVDKFLSLIHQEMPINYKIQKILKTNPAKVGYIVGGLLGGAKHYVHSVFQDFDSGLRKVLNKNALVLEEDLMSCIANFNPSYYEKLHFNQWHHDIPKDPCYYGASSLNKSFYKIFQNELR